MSRLRYNGLATGSSGSTVGLTLGGSLTSGATSVTFSAALTYNNGTAVPTIVAPDYIPLSILDTNGNLSEIVYLTAYTTAGTTGTITRGREGTTGVAHASGDKIVHAPTTTDAPTATLKPSLLHATYGDDFTGGSLDAKWTRVGYVSGDEQYATGAAGTWLQVDTARTTGNYYYQTAPGGDFTLVAKISTFIPSSNVMFGIVCLNASGNGVGACFYTGSPQTVLAAPISGGTYSVGAGAGKGYGPNVAQSGQATWLALNKSSTTYKASFSFNGELWAPWSATVTDSNTPARIGFGGFLGTADAFAIDYFDVQ